MKITIGISKIKNALISFCFVRDCFIANLFQSLIAFKVILTIAVIQS